MWIGILVMGITAAGFSKGVRAAWILALAAQFALWIAWMRGAPPGALSGGGTIFLLVPMILGWIEKQYRTNSSRWVEEEKEISEETRKLVEEEEMIRTRIRAQEGAVQDIAALYDLSKCFLATLEPEQGLQVARDFLGKSLSALPRENREACLHRISGLMEREVISAEALLEVLPSGGDGLAGREHWAIAGEQLALGLQRLCLYRKVQESATHDGLTGLLTRRYFLQQMKDELERAQRRSSAASFLMVDLDHFKEVNDTYGHLVGDVVLREVAQRIHSSVREMDLVGRYGGEEFEVALPEANTELAMQIAERIRLAVESAPIRAYDEEVRITVSIGISVFPRDGKTPVDLIEGADQAMYRAKGLGRNQTAVWSYP